MAWKFQQVEPEAARGKFKEEYMTSPAWDAEVKYDGDRRVCQFVNESGAGMARFTGRTVSKKTGLLVEKTDNVPHLSNTSLRFVQPAQRQFLKDSTYRALEGTVLDGEMVTTQAGLDRGGRSKHVTAIMGSLPEEAVRKQNERGWLTYVVFDCLWYNGKDLRQLPRDERRRFAAQALNRWQNPYAVLAETCPDLRNKRAWLDSLWAAGEEGIILKRRDGVYSQREWVKVKNVIEADCIVTGYEEATRESKKSDGSVSVTKFHERGWIGAIVVSQYRDGKLWECASISGIDDALREEISLNRKKFLGRVVTLKANGREPSGRFRHPQFRTWREDKSAEQCVYREDES
jgi:ATP-dependent DNA ligase